MRAGSSGRITIDSVGLQTWPYSTVVRTGLKSTFGSPIPEPRTGVAVPGDGPDPLTLGSLLSLCSRPLEGIDVKRSEVKGLLSVSLSSVIGAVLGAIGPLDSNTVAASEAPAGGRGSPEPCLRRSSERSTGCSASAAWPGCGLVTVLGRAKAGWPSVAWGASTVVSLVADCCGVVAAATGYPKGICSEEELLPGSAAVGFLAVGEVGLSCSASSEFCLSWRSRAVPDVDGTAQGAMGERGDEGTVSPGSSSGWVLDPAMAESGNDGEAPSTAGPIGDGGASGASAVRPLGSVVPSHTARSEGPGSRLCGRPPIRLSQTKTWTISEKRRPRGTIQYVALAEARQIHGT